MDIICWTLNNAKDKERKMVLHQLINGFIHENIRIVKHQKQTLVILDKDVQLKQVFMIFCVLTWTFFNLGNSEFPHVLPVWLCRLFQTFHFFNPMLLLGWTNSRQCVSMYIFATVYNTRIPAVGPVQDSALWQIVQHASHLLP